MKEMKTPAEILNEHTPLGKGYHSSWVITAMKAYAKQWIDRATDELNDVGVGFPEAYKRVMELKKQIDAQ